MHLELSFDHLVFNMIALILLLAMSFNMLGLVVIRPFPIGNDPDRFKASLSGYTEATALEVL